MFEHSVWYQKDLVFHPDSAKFFYEFGQVNLAESQFLSL